MLIPVRSNAGKVHYDQLNIYIRYLGVSEIL